MTDLQAIKTACISLADEIWSTAKQEDGFALLKTPRRVISILSYLKGETREAFNLDPDLFGKINNYNLVALRWETLIGSSWCVAAFPLTSGRRMYVQDDDNSDGPFILSVSDKNWTPRVDLKFLQRLFRDNGASFGTGVFGTPPNSVNAAQTRSRL